MPHRLARIAAATAVVAAATVALAAAAAAHPQAKHPTLIGTVGKNDAFRITLTTSSGKLVRQLRAGTYTVVIHDDSAIHNYELDGPHGKSWTFTSVSFKGTKRFTLRLGTGAYKAYCAPHESTMFQHFTVR